MSEEIKKITKNLANCKPTEFLVQTNKIRKSVSKWLKDTDVLNIRKNLPELTKVTDDMTDEEKKAVIAENKEKTRAQARENFSKMLDAALETHAQETMELLAMMCFVEPEDIDNYKPTAYLKEFAEIIADKDVIDFFLSLMRLESSGILNTASE